MKTPSPNQRLALIFVATAAIGGIVAYFALQHTGSSPPARRASTTHVNVRPQRGGQGQLDLVVRDAAGAPIAGADVQVRATGLTIVGVARTDATGHARVPGLLDGAFSVLVAHAGHTRAVLPASVAQRHGELAVTLVTGTSLTGSVVDDRGHAVSGARVEVRPENDDSVEPWQLTTIDDGTFSFNTLQTGMQRVSVSAEGFESTSRRSVPTAGAAPLRIDLLRTGTIAGHVRDLAGQAIGYATIVLAGSGVWPPRQVHTAADGAYNIPGVPGGVYEVRAHQGNLVADPREGLLLDPGARVDADLVLQPGVTLNGVVLDADADAPIAGVEVLVTEEALSFSPRAVRTNAQGEFAVSGLRDRDHAVSVRAEGFVALIGEKHRPGVAAVRIALRRAATIRGIVLDSRGAPVRGAQVEITGTTDSGAAAMLSGGALAFQSALFEAQLAGPSPLRQNGELGVTSGGVPPIPLVPSVGGASSASNEFTTGFGTDAEGRFQITGVPPGRIQLTARHIAYAPAEVPTRIVTAGAVIDDVRIILPDGGVIDGRVVDARGYPVPTVRVELTGEHEPYPRGLLAGSDGTFEFRGVLGALTVTAYPVGQPPSRVHVQVAAGQTLPVSVPLETNMVRFFGRVLDSRDFPIPYASIRVRSLRARTPLSQTTESEADGTFVFDALPEPPYQLEANHPDYAVTRIARVASVERELAVHLVEGMLVHGIVTDAFAQAPLMGARVHLESAENVFDAVTNVDGAYELTRVPQGDYVLSVDADAHVSVEQATRVARRRDETEITLDAIALQPGGSISGDVVDRYGELVSGAEVVVGDPPDWTHAVHTDPHGHFVLPGVAAGDAMLLARHPAAGTTEVATRVRVFAAEESPGTVLRLPERFDPSRAQVEDAPRATIAATLRDAGEDVAVRSVRRGSRAEAAGLRAGDIVTAIDEIEVGNARDASGRLRGTEGQDVVIDVQRGDRTLRLVIPRER